MSSSNPFADTITAAVTDILEHGYDSLDRVAYWTEELRRTAEARMTPAHKMEAMMRDALVSLYRRLIDRGAIVADHRGVPLFTIERLGPQLRAELDRRIVASANLIKLDRVGSIQRTLQRFQGWATSVPAGGGPAGKKIEVKAHLRKALGSLPFEERRVIIDQSHKLRASLSEVIAVNGNALAGVWKSRWRQAGYNYREDHKERDGRTYMVRGNWALDKGLIKSIDGYIDQITRVGEEPFCRCYMQWLYAVRDLPAEMVTDKGRAALAEVRRAMERA